MRCLQSVKRLLTGVSIKDRRDRRLQKIKDVHHLHYSFTFKSFERNRQSPKLCVTFLNLMVWGAVSPPPPPPQNHQAGIAHSSSDIHNGLRYSASTRSYPPHLKAASSIRGLGMCHAIVTREPLIMDPSIIHHLWHDSLLWAVAFLGFPDNRIFTGWGCQPHAQPPDLEDQTSVFVTPG
jgi:hypothetical protein